MANNRKARLIAFYLPQFHPTELNDNWWGPGYTEWRSVTQARPLFKGHYQPHEPADLGYYDLRLPEIREKQAQMAKDVGIEGFCYWHYWMGDGRIFLDRPFREVLESGSPDFPFCLGWANHNWTNKNWTKHSSFQKEKNLVEIFYSKEDFVDHFKYVLPAFKDHRYMTVDGKPIFYIWDINVNNYIKEFIDVWRQLAKENGLKGIYFVGLVQSIGKYGVNGDDKWNLNRLSLDYVDYNINYAKTIGFDAVNLFNFRRAELIYNTKLVTLYNKIRGRLGFPTLKVFDYKKMINNLFLEEEEQEDVWPTIMPNWDRSPRAGKEASIYINTTPDVFQEVLEKAIDIVKNKDYEHRVIIIKSWNEWGEGNYLEPDLKYGHGYLDVIKKVINI